MRFARRYGPIAVTGKGVADTRAGTEVDLNRVTNWNFKQCDDRAVRLNGWDSVVVVGHGINVCAPLTLPKAEEGVGPIAVYAPAGKTARLYTSEDDKVNGEKLYSVTGKAVLCVPHHGGWMVIGG